MHTYLHLLLFLLTESTTTLTQYANLPLTFLTESSPHSSCQTLPFGSVTMMKPSPPLLNRPAITSPSPSPLPPIRFFARTLEFIPRVKSAVRLNSNRDGFPLRLRFKPKSELQVVARATQASSSTVTSKPLHNLEAVEEELEKVIYRCRFIAFLGVLGSLVGSFLCFVKGCTYVAGSFMEFFGNRGRVIMLLVEAIDVYLLGTVMLVFGMGLYELFISNLDKIESEENAHHKSNLFGLFTLKERPRWLEVKSVSELKTKLGHVIVMLLLIGLFEKSKKALIHSPVDLLCFAASILLSSGCLFLLSKLQDSK